MSDFHIAQNIIIEDVDTVCKTIQTMSKRTGFTIEDIAAFINQEYFTKFYLDEKLNIKKAEDSANKVLWLDSGFQVSDGKAIFISLLLNGGEYAGFFVGTAATLSKKIAEHYPRNKSMITRNLSIFYNKYQAMLPKREHPHITDLFAELKEEERLSPDSVTSECAATTETNRVDTSQIATALKSVGLTPNTEAFDEYQEEESNKMPPDWVMDLYDELLINTWKRPEGLDRYIKIIGARIQTFIEQKRTEYYIMNNIHSVVVNSGLIDKFGMDVLIYYKLHLRENCYKAYNIIMSKTELLNENFDIKDIKRELVPIQFTEDAITLKASLDDFDINYKSLAHIIDERIDRFPESYRGMKADVLAAKIKSSLEIGLKLQQRDHNYAKPVYSTKHEGVSWYLPLHIHNSLSEPPELVMVIKKVDAFYQVKTILLYDDNIKDRITAMALYGNSW